jgi:hypothetical protein
VRRSSKTGPARGRLAAPAHRGDTQEASLSHASSLAQTAH